MAGIRKKVWKTNNGNTKYCYEVSYYLDGVRCRKAGFKTKLEAQQALPILTKSYSKNITLYDLMTVYIEEHCLLHCKDSTIKLYENYKKNNFTNIKKKKAKDIKKRDIDLLIVEWRKLNISDKTINDLIGFLRAIFQYAIKNKWIPENPAKEVKKITKKKIHINFLNQEEQELFINFINKYPLNRKAALLTALKTGVRISELLAIEWTDIDFGKQTITINKQYYKKKLTEPKTIQSHRKVNMPNCVKDILLELKKQNNPLSQIVFCSKTGGYWSQQKFIDNYFKRAMKYINKPAYSFHSLRHTFATVLLSNGISLKYVQEQLGHSTPQTTLNIYDHVMPSVNEKAIALLDDIKWTHNGHIESEEKLKALI